MTDHTKSHKEMKPTIENDNEKANENDSPRSEWYYDPNGNLEIISSDGIVLRLEAYRLQASSYVTYSILYAEQN